MKNFGSILKPLGLPLYGWVLILVVFFGVGNVNRFLGYIGETYNSAALESKLISDTISYMGEIKKYRTAIEMAAANGHEQYQEELQRSVEFFESAYEKFRYTDQKRLKTPGKEIKPLFITMSYCLDRYKFTVYRQKSAEGKYIYKINQDFFNQAKIIEDDLTEILDKYAKKQIRLPVPDYDYMNKYNIPEWYKQNF